MFRNATMRNARHILFDTVNYLTNNNEPFKSSPYYSYLKKNLPFKGAQILFSGRRNPTFANVKIEIIVPWILASQFYDFKYIL